MGERPEALEWDAFFPLEYRAQSPASPIPTLRWYEDLIFLASGSFMSGQFRTRPTESSQNRTRQSRGRQWKTGVRTVKDRRDGRSRLGGVGGVVRPVHARCCARRQEMSHAPSFCA